MQGELDKNLAELEANVWPEPDFDSHLVRECHRLRMVPLRELTVENLRIMIGQQIGLPYLVPLALEHLEADPFVEGDYYPGDLLTNVLRSSREFWSTHRDLRSRVLLIVANALSLIGSIDLPDDHRSELTRQLNAFKLSET